MKSTLYGLIVFALFGSSAAFAQFLPTEVNLCQGASCTAPMSEIQNAFSSQVEFNPLTTEIGFYSGFCYHLGMSVPAETQHHGGFVLWRGEDEVMQFNGKFSFYAKSNPFADMTPEQGFEYVRTTNPRPVREETTQGHVIISFENATLQYWMRTNPEGSDMYLLSQWDFKGAAGSRSFCHLKRH